MDRLAEKNDLYVKLGALFGPLLRIAEQPDQFDEQEKAETVARYLHEMDGLTAAFREFSRGQPGHNYDVENHRFHNALHGIKNWLVDGRSLAELVRPQFDDGRAAIDAVPIPRTSVILQAGSPFTAYVKLRQLCEVDATKSLTWLDPYFGASVFNRYLTAVRSNVPVTLAASEPGPTAGKANVARWSDFLDVSRLYASEKGPANYRLVVVPNLHDRWVMFDDKRIYGLGGSVKDAANRDYFTITDVESSVQNIQSIQGQIATGTEYFGPATPQHR